MEISDKANELLPRLKSKLKNTGKYTDDELLARIQDVLDTYDLKTAEVLMLTAALIKIDNSVELNSSEQALFDRLITYRKEQIARVSSLIRRSYV